MDIRFDPRLPLVWRDPQTLQIGVDRPRVVVADLTARDERIVAAIASGHGRAGTAVLAQQIGCLEREVIELLEQLAPALVTTRAVPAPIVELAGAGDVADDVAEVLGECGLEVRRRSGDLGEGWPVPALGIAIGDHVHDPVVSGAWLRRDIPHLQVVVGDSLCRVGPVVVPGETACAHCLDLFRAEVDDRWGVIAAQLWGRRGTAPGPVLRRELSSKIARRVLAEVGDGDGPPEVDRADLEMVELDTGRVTRSTSRPHPACGCAALPENDSAGAPSSLGSAPAAPTTGSAAGALA
ncbi:bacteriocin biosynthesis cyclodehydratase domain-containing protein [Frondihabitans sp. PhB188]|nr:bacteriocin biosynthesis cyclodehydratase domain-containing protein [Frondihabitans sp. PhB188]